MCRWGCITIDTTYCCKWCGTRFCAACFHGDFNGEMNPNKDNLTCKKCKQPNCQGKRVEYVPGAKPPEDKSIKSKKDTKKKK